MNKNHLECIVFEKQSGSMVDFARKGKIDSEGLQKFIKESVVEMHNRNKIWGLYANRKDMEYLLSLPLFKNTKEEIILITRGDESLEGKNSYERNLDKHLTSYNRHCLKFPNGLKLIINDDNIKYSFSPKVARYFFLEY